jgi:N-acetylmuramoyl-L-alanine amidase
MKGRSTTVLVTALIFASLPLSLSGQKADFSGIRIFINPGHGGHDSDDRHMLETDFWESDGNLEKGLFLRDLLSDRKATVFMSRTTNYTSDDLPLSTIAAMANTANADIFLSIHSNGFDGTRNQPLTLFRGYDDQPVYPAAKTMATILWHKLFEKANCWTNSFEWVKGDWTFYPEWGSQVGLGVLRTLNMPGVLSEGSYHDYVPEGWRLRNNNHLHHEAWAMLRALEEFENVSAEPTGIIAGTVRDKYTSPDYYFKPGTKDESAPVNNALVTLNPGNISVTLDNLNNGFYMFDSLPPGDYELVCSGIPDFLDDTLNVSVTAGVTTLADFLPGYDTAKVPVVTEWAPVPTDSVPFNQEFTLRFNIPMDKSSVQSALVAEPAVNLVCTWDDKGKVLIIRPDPGYASKTAYTLKLAASAHSLWNVPLETEFQLNFVTFSRTKLKVEKAFPADGSAKITLYPQVRVCFDAPVDQASATAGIRVVNSQSSPLEKVRESFTTTGSKGIYSFELSQPLSLDSQYKVIMDAAVKDITGTSLGQNIEIPFTTRKKAYETGNVVESFDDISVFWDPEASGSTVGTDNPLTTFTSSSQIVRSAPLSGMLNYVFTGENGGLCRVFDTRKPLIGSSLSLSFGMWVFGDLSGNILEYWFYSPGTVNQIVIADTIDWAGWDLISIPFSRIGGTGDWQYHSLVVRQSETGAKTGTMFFDDAMVFTTTGVEDISDIPVEVLVFPNPFASYMNVEYFLGTVADVSVDLFNTDGKHLANIFIGEEGPGKCVHHWNVPDNVPAGAYMVRVTRSHHGISSSSVKALRIK